MATGYTRRFAALSASVFALAAAPASATESPKQFGGTAALPLAGTSLNDASQLRRGFGNVFRGGRGFRRGFGGFGVYRRPFRGFILPRFFLQRTFFITNFQTYRLAHPARGYRWLRYYDDAVLADRDGRVSDVRHDVDWSAGQSARDVTIVYDTHGIERGGPIVTQGGEYEGAWSGSRIGPNGEVYDGSWSGTYTDEQGNSYQGEYSGRFVGEGTWVAEDGTVHRFGDARKGKDAAATTVPRPGEKDVDFDERAEFIEKCRRDNGLGGALLGGALGAIAGNRIAGRGNRTEGTLIGAGVGAVTGAVIDKAEDDPCREIIERHRGRRHAARYAYPYGYYGYYGYPAYYYAPQVVTVTVTAGNSTVSETSVEEYITVPRTTKKRAKPIKRLSKPQARRP